MSKKKRPTPVPPSHLYPLFDAHTHISSTVPKRLFDLLPHDWWEGACPEAQEQLSPEFVAEYSWHIQQLMDTAAASGVAGICTVGDGVGEAELALQAALLHPRIWAACAVHPTKADSLNAAARHRLRALAAHPRCVAVGETGLDTYWLRHDPDTPALEVQEEALRWHIDLAVELNKPLMIHNREADEDLLRVLADAPQPPAVILHCFSSPQWVAREALDRGYVLSFAGNATFKRNEELREAARIAPAEQILVETDAPYMTPEPFRGCRNEPAFVGYTARVLAEVRGQAPEDFAAAVTANALRVYGIDCLWGADATVGAATPDLKSE